MFLWREKSATASIIEKKLLQLQYQGVSFKELESDFKRELREALLARQGYRCAYCETQINNKEHKGKSKNSTASLTIANKIEHFHPQSKQQLTASCQDGAGTKKLDAADLNSYNLLIVCSGKTSLGMRCDTAKADRDICAQWKNPNRLLGKEGPIISPHQASLVVVERSGRVVPNPVYFSSTEISDAQEVLDDVLYLNSPQLINVRKDLYVELVKNFNDLRARFHKRQGTGKKSIKEEYFSKLLKEAEESNKALLSTYYSFVVDGLN